MPDFPDDRCAGISAPLGALAGFRRQRERMRTTLGDLKTFALAATAR